MIAIPCYETNIYTLAFKAKNIPIMMEVLNDMGLDPREIKNGIKTSIGTFNLNTGEIEVSSRSKEKVVNEFRKNYSKRIIDVTAKKFKWNVKKKKIGSKTVYNAVKW